ncbi:hypothetical protein ABZ832_10635 [Streptantibioticus parmotrematis]|uniref:hypothetical protein n=1 Tax=Streptantibioticus parmotrematis TaxID=2873249 RepID=UPI00340DA30B
MTAVCAEPGVVLLESAHGLCRLVSARPFDPAATPAAPWSPGLRVLPDAERDAAGPEVLTCWYEDAGPAGLCWEDGGVRVRLPWQDTAGGAEIGYVAAVLMERDRQRHGYFTLHSASAALGRSGVLLLGKEGAGKTSVLTHLCLAHGAELIGNDLSVIGGPGPRYEIAAGTRFLFLRQASVSRSMRALDLPAPARTGLDSWRTKWMVDPAEAGISVAEGPRPLDHVFSVHVDESQDGLRVEAVDDAATLLHLHENAARYVRGTATHVLHGRARRPLGYLPSLDTESFYLHRVRVIEHLAAELGIHYVSGPAAAVAAHIAEAVR